MMSLSSDYERIERAIEYLDRHAREQPSLERVAKSSGLSPSHFQRVFTRWAGVSPKRFLQFQTVAHAKSVLEESKSLLQATYESGLSGPSRLHDLFVSVEAVTPGEWKSGGVDLDIRYGIHDGPFGRFLLAVTGRGICALRFLPASGAFLTVLNELRSEWPEATITLDPKATQPYADHVFPSDGAAAPAGPLSLYLKGTNFQTKVWEALIKVPMGALVSYEELASSAGTPSAVRAVAGAVASNPIAWLIPCHRVIRKTGAFGGYRWGQARKRAMLGWEAVKVAS
jgi:AraC family transcriptional regulator of adaptative response/methylated-DNA-[protein]-cysteine methyltransferase